MVCAVREGADRIRFCLEHCGAAEEKSGIGGSMVRTTKKKAAEAGLAGENAKVAAQSVDYWSSVTHSLLANPDVTGSEYALKSYSHDVNSTANLLAANNFTDQAEQAYALASQLFPGNPEPVNGLAQLLTQTGHADQAQTLINQFVSKYPDLRSAVQQPQMTITANLAPSGH